MNTVHERTLGPTSKQVVFFAREKYSKELVDEMLPLWKEHYDEIALYKDIPLSPDLKVYGAAEFADILRIFTARQEGKLIGYEVFLVHNHPHYSTCRSANQDILFLSKDLRRGFMGYRFIKWADEMLKEDGVQVVFQHVKVSHDFSPLLKRLGYVEHDILYSKRLS